MARSRRAHRTYHAYASRTRRARRLTIRRFSRSHPHFLAQLCCARTFVDDPWHLVSDESALAVAAWTWSLDPVTLRSMQAELAVGHVEFCRDRPTIVSGATAGQDAPAIGPSMSSYGAEVHECPDRAACSRIVCGVKHFGSVHRPCV